MPKDCAVVVEVACVAPRQDWPAISCCLRSFLRHRTRRCTRLRHPTPADPFPLTTAGNSARDGNAAVADTPVQDGLSCCGSVACVQPGRLLSLRGASAIIRDVVTSVRVCDLYLPYSAHACRECGSGNGHATTAIHHGMGHVDNGAHNKNDQELQFVPILYRAHRHSTVPTSRLATFDTTSHDASGWTSGGDAEPALDPLACTVIALPHTSLDGLWESLHHGETAQSSRALKRELLEYVLTALSFSAAGVSAHCVAWNRLLLFHGPPGTGKTSLARALAQKTAIRLTHLFPQARLVEVNAHSLFSRWFSESGKHVMRVFDAIHRLAHEETMGEGGSAESDEACGSSELDTSDDTDRGDDAEGCEDTTDGVMQKSPSERECASHATLSQAQQQQAHQRNPSHPTHCAPLRQPQRRRRSSLASHGRRVRCGKTLVCVLLDEVESIAAARQSAMRGHEPSDSIRVVNALLTQLDRLQRVRNVLIIATSNLTDAIDDAFLDRADKRVHMTAPGLHARRAMLCASVKELLRRHLLTSSASTTAPKSATEKETCDAAYAGEDRQGVDDESSRDVSCGCERNPVHQYDTTDGYTHDVCCCCCRRRERESATCPESKSIRRKVRRIGGAGDGRMWADLESLARRSIGLNGRRLKKLPFLAYAAAQGAQPAPLLLLPDYHATREERLDGGTTDERGVAAGAELAAASFPFDAYSSVYMSHVSVEVSVFMRHLERVVEDELRERNVTQKQSPQKMSHKLN